MDFRPNVCYYPETDELVMLKQPVSYTHENQGPISLLRSQEDGTIIGVVIEGFRENFLHAGIRIDPEYMEGDPLSEEDELFLDRLLGSIDFDLFAPSTGKKA